MVVLAASIVSKSGKVLVSTQFVEMSHLRIKGLLAAFSKLVDTEKQHTYVETQNVRYLYQPIEGLYLVLVTNKQSNILEDLETLRLLSKLVPEYSISLDEEGICGSAFELMFAFVEVVSFGYKENVTVAQVKQHCEMESDEERLHRLVIQKKINEAKEVMKRKASEIYRNKIAKNGTVFCERNISIGRTNLVSTESQSKGHHAPAKGLGMQLGASKRRLHDMPL